MNSVRKLLEFNYEEIKDTLDAAYKSIELFQKSCDSELLKADMENSIMKAVKVLEMFKTYIPAYKQKYFDVLENHEMLELTSRDIIMTFDRMVYELHTRMGKNLSNSTEFQAWSPLMMEILDGRRAIPDKGRDINGKNDINLEFIASGFAVVNGYVKSRGKIVSSNADFQNIRHGDILISRMTTPDIVCVIDRIAGIATEQGGQLCHAAVLAREFNIPCVVGCGQFINNIKDEENLILDADNGMIYRESK